MQKKLWLLLLGVILAVGLTACQGDQGEEETTNPEDDQTVEEDGEQGEEGFESVTLTDKTDTEVTIEEEPETIVSVLPSATEIVYAVDAGDKVVGVSQWANYPEEVSEVEKVGDQQLNIEKIVSLDPDLVVADLNNADDIDALRNAGLDVLVLGAQSIDQVYEDIKLVGQATGHTGEAENVIDDMQTTIDDVTTGVSDLTEEEKKRVWVEVGPELFSGGEGSFIDEVIELAGGVNIIGDQEGWPQVSEEVVLEKDPDVIITTYGYHTEDAVDQVLARDNWQGVTAIQEEQVYDLHSDLLTRPGPRLADGLKELAETLYPDLME
ncbi:ABC transporter substrate-binding protein [Aquisalibacillus elongatus]|uniref:Iron complex transport system substrate-binding protein n=1 Tax=Aquisalibacillus elongatus TaxID=485577 RepID=A0A3N5BGZ0_9BACI|nr:ABC transporter substrate-binding protein [Aquisalibacillus elongatus]RPF57054.1 iron complex transport system substrate-binding protein [Aquisalibacillus elongatus]